MSDPREEACRWLGQANNDLSFARVGLREGYYAKSCFLAQQAAQKVLKAVRYARGDRVVLGHSVWDQLRVLASDFPKLAIHQDSARQLDLLYVPTRYPNSLPAGAPFEVFSAEQAKGAVELANRVFADAKKVVAGLGAGRRKKR